MSTGAHRAGHTRCCQDESNACAGPRDDPRRVDEVVTKHPHITVVLCHAFGRCLVRGLSWSSQEPGSARPVAKASRSYCRRFKWLKTSGPIRKPVLGRHHGEGVDVEHVAPLVLTLHDGADVVCVEDGYNLNVGRPWPVLGAHPNAGGILPDRPASQCASAVREGPARTHRRPGRRRGGDAFRALRGTGRAGAHRRGV